MATEEIRAALEAGELESLVLFGADPLRDFPDTEAWRRALAAADHLIVFSIFENETTAMADVVLPLETHAEKDGTVTHPDGRLQRVRPSAARPGDIRPNWGILAELSLALGHDTGVGSQPSAFAALAAEVPFYAGIDDADIGGRGDPLAGSCPSCASRAPEVEEAVGSALIGQSARSAGRSHGRRSAARGVASAEAGPAASFILGTYRDLWAGPDHRAEPTAEVSGSRSSESRSRSATPNASG